MARVPPSVLARFGRSFRASATAIRPAVPFALKAGAFAAGGAFLLSAGGRVASDISNAFNPPLQRERFDPDPSRPGDETELAFDRKTGQLYIFGQPSTEKTAPTRTIDRTLVYGILGVTAVALAIVFLGRRR